MNSVDTSRRLTRVPCPGISDKLRRSAWLFVEAVFYRLSPVPLHGWRRFLLRCFGASVGSGSHPYPSARVWAPWNLAMGAGSCLGPKVICYSVAQVTLEPQSVVSQGAHLCSATHDHRDPDFPLVVGPITIGCEAWVAADAFVGPGVTIGARAVAGARAVVVKDVAPGLIVAGNPARVVSKR